MAAKDIEVKVKYIPDTSALKSAMSGMSGIDFKAGNSNVKKELVAPVQAAMKEVNKALASGADSSTLLQLFKKVGKEADAAKTKASAMLSELNTVFNSSGNQKLLKDLEEYRKKISQTEKQIENWDKKFGNATMKQMKTDLYGTGKGGVAEARKEIASMEEQVKIGKQLTQQDEERLTLLKKYVSTWNERQATTPKNELESQLSEYRAKEGEILTQVQTPQINVERTKELTNVITQMGAAYGLSTEEINKLTAAIKTQEDVANQGKKELVKFGDVLTGTFLGTSLSNLFQTGLQRGVQFFKEYDEILTRTMMVTGMARDEVNALTSSYNRLANQLSSTTKDVAAAQLVFYQQGLGTQEALSMTEASIAISKTGGIEASEAANRLTAAIRGYQLAANDAMNIADKMSALDAAAASSVDELTIAMQKSASQARMAGLDLDYYMAYLSTMQEVTREAPENIGTAMKSITARIQEIRDIGKIEEDGTTFSNVAKALNSIGIAATDSSGQLRNLQDIMNELGPIWATLDRNHKAYIATTLAGNRQQSRFIALMDNYDRAMELVNVSQNASGESAKQLRAYNQGLEASFTRLTNAWQQFATRVADSDSIKKIVDALADLIELINKIPKEITGTVTAFLALNTVFKTFSALSKVPWKSSIAQWLGLDKDAFKDIKGLEGAFEGLGKTVKKARDSIVSAFDTWGNNSKQIDKVTEAMDANTVSVEANQLANVANTAAKEADNLTDTVEVTEAIDTKIAQDAMTKAYNAGTEAVSNQLKVMSSNTSGYIQEQERALREAKAKMQGLKDQEQELLNSQEQINNSTKKELADLRQAYESRVKDPRSRESGGMLYEEAVLNLQNKGLLSDGPQQMSLFGDTEYDKLVNAEMERLAHEYGVGYNELQNIAKSSRKSQMEINNKAISDLRKYKTELNKEIQGIQNNISKYQKSLDELTNGKTATKKQPKKLSPEQKLIYDKKHAPEQLENFKNAKTASFGDLKGLWSNKSIGNIDKLSATLGKLNITSGLVIGSFAQMGASMIGLDEDASNAIGIGAGLAKTFAGIAPPWGAIIGASIGLVSLGLDKLIITSKEAQETLTKLQEEADNLKQEHDDLSTNLKVYNELRNKLDKTEEETQQLADATNALAEALPSAVIGYDNLGNAIINTGAVMSELNNLQEEQIANSKKQLKSFNDLQKAEQRDGWSIGADILSVLDYIGNPIAKIAEDLTGQTFTLTGIIQEKFIEPRDIEANKKILKENYSEVYGQLQQMVADIVEEGSEENAQARQVMANSLLNSLISDATNGTTVDETSIKKLQERVQNLFNKIDDGSMDLILDMTDRIKLSGNITEASWNELYEQVVKQLRARTATLDLTDEEFEMLVKVTMDASWDMDVNVGSIQEEIKTAMDKSSDNEWKVKAQYFSDSLGVMERDMLQLLKDMNLLDASFADLFDLMGGNPGMGEAFRNARGEIDATKGSLIMLTKAYEARDESEVEGLKQQKKDLEQKKKDLETEREATMNAYLQSGILDLSTKNMINNEYKQKIKDVEEEIDAVNTKIGDANQQLNYTDKIIDQIISSFQGADVPTFDELAESIRETADEMQRVKDLAESLDETDGFLTGDSLANLFDILGQYEEAAELTTEDWELWNHAINSINDGLSVQNGKLHLEAGAIAGINDLVQVQNKLKYEQIVASIEQAQQELELQNQILQTQYDAVDAAIKELEAGASSVDAQSKLNKTLDEELAMYTTERVVREVKANNSILDYADQFATQYSKIMAAAQNGNYNSGDFKKATADYNSILNKMKSDMKEQFGTYYNEDSATYKANLEALRDDIKDKMNRNQEIIDGQLELKRKITDYLASGNTNLADTFKEAEDATSDYNGKLERTLTLLEKIEGLQHSIEENETFKSLYEGYDGESYGRIMMSNLKLAKEQYDVYKDLFAMQQEITNQAAGDLLDSPYGEMFKIEENGDLGWSSDEMYDKYKGLPGEMQEDIDNLVEAYQKQRDELRDTEQSLSVYAQAVKEAREELVEMEIEIENELVDALKNREKIMHEARKKAIEDEIKMIEEAVEVRKKARDEDESEKELYKAQEALRRATLDSSGKNNAQLLQLQQDLEDKQLEISEKRFEDDMEDRKNWLQDTKDAETETYEYRLETMTWYWENVQAIQEAGQEEMMQTLIHWNEEYRTTSQLQQSEMLREWQFTMDAMKSAADLGAELDQLTTDIVEVTAEVESMNISIDKLPGTWKAATDAANAYAAAASQASQYSYGGNPGSGNTGGGDKKDDDVEKIPEADFEVNKKVQSNVGMGVMPYKDNGDGTFTQKKNRLLDGYVFLGHYKIKKSAYDAKNKRWMYYLDTTPDAWFAENQLKYKEGGIVDYTGPAWVDGTKTKPEAFLNSYQTEQIAALAGALDSKSINSANMNSNVTFGSINFNVASMSSAADGKKALEVFVQGANDLMAKKGIGTKLNMNVK